MNKLEKYIEEILGDLTSLINITENQIEKLPFYLLKAYHFYEADLMGKAILFVIPKEEDISIQQLGKHLELLRQTSGRTIVFVMNNLAAFNRKRLIEKKINFIVPGKQLYIPELLMDLRETFISNKNHSTSEKLIPTAQFILIYHILHRYNNKEITNFTFKELAGKIGYSPMAISKAAENLKRHDLIEVEGSKEKRIHFTLNRMELWNTIERQNLWINPVLKRVFVDERPQQALLKCNASALPEYTDMNPSRQAYYAIEKTAYYALLHNSELNTVNDREGKYCLELWKYNPLQIAEEMHNDDHVVDPLSLYLSLKDEQDERVEMALNQIIEKYIW